MPKPCRTKSCWKPIRTVTLPRPAFMSRWRICTLGIVSRSIATASEHDQALGSSAHQPSTGLVFGLNSVDRVGELTREIGARKVLLVTDPGIVAAGHADRARRKLESAGVKVAVFDQARENPTTKCV